MHIPAGSPGSLCSLLLIYVLRDLSPLVLPVNILSLPLPIPVGIPLICYSSGHVSLITTFLGVSFNRRNCFGGGVRHYVSKRVVSTVSFFMHCDEGTAQTMLKY